MSELGAWPCGVCGKDVDVNSLHCTSRGKCIYMMSRGVKGNLQAASAAFIRRQCQGKIPPICPKKARKWMESSMILWIVSVISVTY